MVLPSPIFLFYYPSMFFQSLNLLVHGHKISTFTFFSSRKEIRNIKYKTLIWLTEDARMICRGLVIAFIQIDQ